MDIDERYNKMNNRPNWKSYVFVVLVCFLTYKFLPVKTYRQVTNQEVELWKNKLLQVYFKGEVMSININDNHERLSRTIYLKILDTANVIIPDSCEYFKLQKGMLLLTAANLNISTGPNHQIEKGDIITKMKSKDSICVYIREGCLKYYFLLFDGLGSTPLKMQITATSPCHN